MSTNRRVVDVGGTAEFRKFFNSLAETDSFKKEIRDASNNLKQDLSKGEKIAKGKWPASYKKLGVTNLWVYRLGSGGRLIYTIMSDADGFLGSVIEAFRTHEEYEKRFGY